MITYFTFEPSYFNNNGDQGNLEVLLYFLSKAGLKAKKAESPKGADFVLVGDASLAVMEHFSKKLASLRKDIKKRFESGLPTLIVGSSYEFFSEELGLKSIETSRRSGFVSTVDGYFGYRNSASSLPDVFTNKAFVATKLFGPVLAKNPKLLEIELSALGVQLKMDQQVASWVEAIRQKSD
jgi:CobQ-like glutamine amidotransferase family enzyme